MSAAYQELHKFDDINMTNTFLHFVTLDKNEVAIEVLQTNK